jgi:Protein of unknown function (DUF3307)
MVREKFMEQLITHLFGDYIFQSEWMANGKTKTSWPALVHALVYSLCFVPLCWVAAKDLTPKPDVCITYVDRLGNETICQPVAMPKDGERFSPQLAPGAVNWNLYATRPMPVWTPRYFRWLPWLVIFGSHFLIDRFRLARYVVWVKNFIGPRRMWLERRDYKNGKDGAPFLLADLNEDFNYTTVSHSVIDRHWINPPLHHCPAGYPSTTPIWLSTWLLIIADNTLHLAINYAALRWL